MDTSPPRTADDALHYPKQQAELLAQLMLYAFNNCKPTDKNNTQRKKPPDVRLVRGFRGGPVRGPPRSLLFHLTGLPNRNKGSGSYPFLRLTLGPRLLGPGASYTLSPVPHCPAREPRGSVGPLPEAVRGGNLQAECTG